MGTMLFIPRLLGGLAAVLASVALLLGLTGLYGVIAYDVNRRTREVGVRMALGSTTGRVMMLVLSKGLRLVIPGLAAGLVIASILSQPNKIHIAQ